MALIGKTGKWDGQVSSCIDPWLTRKLLLSKKKVGIVLSHGTVGLRPECVRNYAVDHALEG